MFLVFLVFIDDAMNLEGLPAALIVVLVCFVAAAGLWYLAIRFRLRQLKIMAVAIVAAPVLGFGFQIGSHYFGWFDPPDYVTTTPGPARREASVIREFPFPVPNPHFLHQIELTPRSDTGQRPGSSMTLHFIVRTPKALSMCSASLLSCSSVGC